MNSTALTLILISVFLHATWNFLCKKDKPTMGFFLVFSLSIFSVMLPFLLLSGINPLDMPKKVWLALLCGGTFGLIGNIGMTYAYNNEDISKAYPMIRALPIIFIAIITTIFNIGTAMSLISWIGIIVVFSGCIAMSIEDLKNIKLKDYFNKGMLGVIIVALATTGYTISDNFGINIFKESITTNTPRILQSGSYSCCREFTVIIMSLIIFCLPTKIRPVFNLDAFKRPNGYLSGIGAGLAYVLILTAMGYVENVSYIQVFRQLSLPIGMVLGFIFLKEKVTIQRIIAIILIMLGLAITTIGKNI